MYAVVCLDNMRDLILNKAGLSDREVSDEDAIFGLTGSRIKAVTQKRNIEFMRMCRSKHIVIKIEEEGL